jgi:hypothetical protein
MAVNARSTATRILVAPRGDGSKKEKGRMDLPKPEDWKREKFFVDHNYIASQSPEGGVFVRRRDGVLWVMVEGEASGDNLVSAFRQAIDQGVIDLWMPSFVDLTRFTGAVDWAAVRTVRDMAAWGRGHKPKSRVAYVLRDRRVVALVKIVAVLFPRSNHRAFYDFAEAARWITSDAGEAAAKP